MAAELSLRDLRKFDRSVAVLIAELVNHYNVTYRLPKDGNHVLLYNGNREERPFKVSAHRPGRDSVIFLEKWIEENVSNFGRDFAETEVRSVEKSVFTCAYGCEGSFPTQAAVDYHHHTKHPPEPGATPYTYGTGRTSVCFIVHGKGVRCTLCGTVYDHRRGLHFHEASHTGQMAVWASQGQASRRLVKENERLVARIEKMMRKLNLIREVLDEEVDEDGPD